MSSQPLNVLAVIGSLRGDSVTRVVVTHVVTRLKAGGCAVDVLDLEKEPLSFYRPDTAETQPGFAAIKARVNQADIFILATPDYHGSFSGVLKNFLDHFWREFAGKLFALVVASHEKGLTVMDQLRTVARQCYAWTLPYGVAFTEDVDVKDSKIVGDQLPRRLDMMIRDARVYGEILARQRRADLAGNEPGFMARLRK